MVYYLSPTLFYLLIYFVKTIKCDSNDFKMTLPYLHIERSKVKPVMY